MSRGNESSRTSFKWEEDSLDGKMDAREDEDDDDDKIGDDEGRNEDEIQAVHKCLECLLEMKDSNNERLGQLEATLDDLWTKHQTEVKDLKKSVQALTLQIKDMREVTHNHKSKLKEELASTKNLILEQEDRIKSMIVITGNSICNQRRAKQRKNRLKKHKLNIVSHKSPAKCHYSPHKSPKKHQYSSLYKSPVKDCTSCHKSPAKCKLSPKQSSLKSEASPSRSPVRSSYSPRNVKTGSKENMKSGERWDRSLDQRDDVKHWSTGTGGISGAGVSRRRGRVAAGYRKWMSMNNLEDWKDLDTEKDGSDERGLKKMNIEYKLTLPPTPGPTEEKNTREERFSEVLARGDIICGKGFARDAALDSLFDSSATQPPDGNSTSAQNKIICHVCNDVADGSEDEPDDLWRVEIGDDLSSERSSEDGEMVIESKYRNSYREMMKRRKSIH